MHGMAQTPLTARPAMPVSFGSIGPHHRFEFQRDRGEGGRERGESGGALPAVRPIPSLGSGEPVMTLTKAIPSSWKMGYDTKVDARLCGLGR